MSLVIRDLSVSYGPVQAVRGLSLQIEPGEVVAVVGESGSGKSTTAHAITGLLPPGGRIDGGSISFGELRLDQLPERRLRGVRGKVIGLVPQDPTVSLNPVQRIGVQVTEALRVHHLADRRSAPTRAAELLERVGIPGARARQYPHELSGGLRQRVLIAIAIAASPQLIVADEPTSALDVTVQKRILDLLGELRAESGTAMLLVTHDLAVAAERAQRLVVMKDGRVVEEGPTRQILADPRHEYTRTLLAARAVDERPPLGPGPVLVEARGLTKRFGSLTAVDDVSFTIERGRTHALVGESGSGKSTTARLLLRLAEPDFGAVEFEGTDLVGTNRLREYRRRMQVVYQNPYASLDPRYTVEKIVVEPLRVFGIGSRAERQATARELLDRVALPPSLLIRKPSELSGGQRQRVAIARALALKPDLVVLDEPVSALDASVSAQVLDLLTELQDELGVAYLFISHDLGVVRRIAHTVGVMKDGRVVEQGPAGKVLNGPEHPYTQELLAAVPGPA